MNSPINSPINSPSPSPFPIEVLKCSDCKLFRHPAMFEGLTRNYKTCARCRYLQTPPKLAPSFLDMNFLSQLPIDAFFFSEGTGSRMECDLFMNDRLLALDNEEVALEVIDQISQQTGYRHTLQVLATTSCPILLSSMADAFIGMTFDMK